MDCLLALSYRHMAHPLESYDPRNYKDISLREKAIVAIALSALAVSAYAFSQPYLLTIPIFYLLTAIYKVAQAKFSEIATALSVQRPAQMQAYPLQEESLPEELMMIIGTFLSLSDIRTMKLTCRRWNKIFTNDLFWKLYSLRICKPDAMIIKPLSWEKFYRIRFKLSQQNPVKLSFHVPESLSWIDKPISFIDQSQKFGVVQKLILNLEAQKAIPLQGEEYSQIYQLQVDLDKKIVIGLSNAESTASFKIMVQTWDLETGLKTNNIQTKLTLDDNPHRREYFQYDAKNGWMIIEGRKIVSVNHYWTFEFPENQTIRAYDFSKSLLITSSNTHVFFYDFDKTHQKFSFQSQWEISETASDPYCRTYDENTQTLFSFSKDYSYIEICKINGKEKPATQRLKRELKDETIVTVESIYYESVSGLLFVSLEINQGKKYKIEIYDIQKMALRNVIYNDFSIGKLEYDPFGGILLAKSARHIRIFDGNKFVKFLSDSAHPYGWNKENQITFLKSNTGDNKSILEVYNLSY